MKKMDTLDWISLVLLVVGGINWGLFGAFGLDLVAVVFGASVIAKIVYILVGVAAVYVMLISIKPAKQEA